MKILSAVKDMGASDAHFQDKKPVMVRVEGVLKKYSDECMGEGETEAFFSGMADEDKIKELNRSGRIRFAIDTGNAGRIRTDLFLERGGYSAVVRFIPDHIPDTERCEIPKEITELTHNRSGIIIFSGSHGSGKTTAAASLTDHINHNREAHIVTVENPVEYVFDSGRSMITQIEAGSDAGSMRDAIKEAAAIDSDVIMVGDMTGKDEIKEVINAAGSGRLVIAVMNETGADDVIRQIIRAEDKDRRDDIKERLSSVIRAVVITDLIPGKEGRRIPVHEIMIADQAVRNLIREEKYNQINTMIQTGKNRGMITMDDDLYELCILERIDKETAIRYSRIPENMKRKL